MRIVRPLLVALAAAALAAHVAYWYLPRARTAAVDASSPAGELFAGGDQAVRALACLSSPERRRGGGGDGRPGRGGRGGGAAGGSGRSLAPGVRAVLPAAVRRVGDRGRARRRAARRHHRSLSGGRGVGARRRVDRGQPGPSRRIHHRFGTADERELAWPRLDSGRGRRAASRRHRARFRPRKGSPSSRSTRVRARSSRGPIASAARTTSWCWRRRAARRDRGPASSPSRARATTISRSSPCAPARPRR